MSLNAFSRVVVATFVSIGAFAVMAGNAWCAGDDSTINADAVDTVSAATPPPDLFVEIISPSEGETVAAGTSISAFGGPGWAIPELELHMDGEHVDSMAGYNVTFTIDPSTAAGSHTFKVEFTCVLDSCNGQTASAEVTVNITASQGGPADGGASNSGGDADAGVPDSNEPTQPGDETNGDARLSGATCNAGGAFSGSGMVLLLAIGMLMVRRRRQR